MGTKEILEVDGTDSELCSMVVFAINNNEHMDSRETVSYINQFFVFF
jgi:hypothetical protein